MEEDSNKLQILNSSDKDRIIELVGNECRKAEIVAGNLLQAPLACCIIEAMTILAACSKDTSLKSNNPDEKFIYLRRSTSFKASFFQVINEMSEAFRTADISMDTIQTCLSNIPELMVDCLEAMKNINDPSSQDTIDYALKFIDDAAGKCVKAAENADNDCKNALKFIQELCEAALATQGRKEKRVEDAKIEQEEQQRLKIQTEEELKYIKERIKEQKIIIEDAKEDFKRCMAQSSQFTEVFGAMFLDNVSRISKLLKVLAYTMGDIPQRALEILDNDNLVSYQGREIVLKGDLLAQTMEKTLYNYLEDILSMPYEILVSKIDTFICSLEFSKMYETSSAVKKLLLETRKDMIQALQSIKNQEAECKKNYEIAKVKADINLKNYKGAQELIDAEKLKQMTSEERQTLMRTRLDNLKISREDYVAKQKFDEKLNNERNAATAKLSEIITNLHKLDVEEVDLKYALEYLQEGIQQLTQVQVAWEKIVKFFCHIKSTVNGPLVTHLLGMTTNVQRINGKTEKFVSEYQQKILLREVIKACAVSSILMQCAKLYKNISKKYISDITDRSIINMALTKDVAEGMRQRILSNFNRIKDDVQQTIDDHVKEFSINIYRDFEKQGFNVGRAIQDKRRNNKENISLEI